MGGGEDGWRRRWVEERGVKLGGAWICRVLQGHLQGQGEKDTQEEEEEEKHMGEEKEKEVEKKRKTEGGGEEGVEGDGKGSWCKGRRKRQTGRGGDLIGDGAGEKEDK